MTNQNAVPYRIQWAMPNSIVQNYRAPRKVNLKKKNDMKINLGIAVVDVMS